MTDKLLSDPLVPAEVDLRDFAFMPVDVKRLLTSDTWMLGSGEERAAAMGLWLESWHQVPAASVPENDRVLQHLAQCSSWKKVRVHVLRGWVKATDGRLYHPVVAEKALEAWLEKLAQRISGGVGNAKRWNVIFDPTPIEAQMQHARGLLQTLNPQSRALTKRRTSGLPTTSRRESLPDPVTVGQGSRTESPPDSGNDRKGQGQGQGHVNPVAAALSTGNSAAAAAAELFPPKSVPASVVTPVLKLLTGRERGQEILDEWAGIMRNKGSGNPAALIKDLIAQVERNEFIPTYAHVIAAEREEEQVRRELEASGRSTSGERHVA